ncbi:sugar porter family MFS transporter [Facilibium subflavum]|uniref:sugar porter family MFS transporter n=1 Tax=Facilibium subflavum TaxID=2219058 RepID=UPI000E655F11|nr:sugar porter family MFS transporter [Facilibium subflavum]
MKNVQTKNTQYQRIVYMICLIGALGGLLFGLDQGFIANSLSTIDHVYTLNISQGENYSAVLAWGGILGALLSGLFARTLGRKKVLVLAGFLFSVLSFVSALLPPLAILVACRFGLGFAVGVASFTVPLYLSETAPTSIRGGMATLFQLMITIGIFLIAATNVFIAKILGHTEISLRLMFAVILIFAFVMFLGSLFLPESPRWLMLKGKHDKALDVLNKVRSSKEEIQKEVAEIKESIAVNQGSGAAMLTKGFFWKILLVGVVLQMFQQLVGINMMIYYAPTIFGYAGMTGLIALLAIPTVNMLFTFPAVKWIEKWGRKKLLYFGAVIMMVSMFSAGFAFLSIHESGPSSITNAVLLLSAIVYIFGFACSWGPVAWVICAEIFPLKGREIGMTVTTMVNWTFAGLVMANALSFMKAYGNYSIFFVFGGFCILSMVFLKFFVPETKGVSLEKIEKNLEDGVPLRQLGDTESTPQAPVQTVPQSA